MLENTMRDPPALALELFRAVDAGDLARTATLLDDDLRLHYHGVPDPITKATLLEMIRGYRSVFPDMRHEVLQVLPIADHVTLRMVVHGTHRATYEGIAATGRQVTVAAIHILRVDDGRIAEWWAGEDDLGLLRQLGATVRASDPIKATARRYFDELLNGRRIAVVDEIIAEACAIVVPGVPDGIRGIETIRAVLAGLHTTFPDLRFAVHDLIAEDDRVVATWTMSGTHQGEWLGMPATGRSLAITGTDIFTMAGGKIVRIEIQADYLGAMRQMGATVSP